MTKQILLPDNDEVHEKVINKIEIIKQLKEELKTEFGKDQHYELVPLIQSMFEQICIDQRTEYIQYHKQNYQSHSTGGQPRQSTTPVTSKQKKFIDDLGGDPDKPNDAVEASNYIDALKKKKQNEKDYAGW